MKDESEPPDFAALLKKLQSGKTLTASERDFLATNSRPTNGKKESGDHTDDRCKFWGVRKRTMQQFKQDGLPVDDPAGMVKWYVDLPSRSQLMLGAEFRRRLNEERVKLEGPRALEDPDVAEFAATYQPSDADAKDNLAEIKRERAYYLFRMQRCRARKDYAGEAEAAKHFRNFSDVVHDCELRARKLGHALGESFSADDVDRVGQAIGYWLLRSVDESIGAIAAAISGVVPVERERVRQLVEPILICDRVMMPLVRAAKVNAGIKLPERFVAALKAGAASVLENGAEEFDRHYAHPVPPQA